MSGDGADALDLLLGPARADARVLGALPRGAGTAALARHAARREAVVLAHRARTVGPRGSGTVWRQRPASLRPGSPRDALVRRLAGGVVLTGATGLTSPAWARVLTAAAVRPLGAPAVGADGSLRLLVREAAGGAAALVLRVGRQATPADPAPAAEALRRLGRAGVGALPQPVRGGCTDGWSWTLERRLPGRRPRRLSARLVADVAAWLATLPGADGPADLARHADAVAAAAAGERRHVAELVRRLRTHPVAARGTTVHGDLWAGNLLVRRGRLSGVVDWDAAAVGVPGTDLVHLVGTDLRLRRRCSLGRLVELQPWHDPPLRPLLAALGAVDPPAREVVGAAWWLQQAGADLRRAPWRREDRRWVEDNVLRPLAALRGTQRRGAQRP